MHVKLRRITASHSTNNHFSFCRRFKNGLLRECSSTITNKRNQGGTLRANAKSWRGLPRHHIFNLKIILFWVTMLRGHGRKIVVFYHTGDENSSKVIVTEEWNSFHRIVFINSVTTSGFRFYLFERIRGLYRLDFGFFHVLLNFIRAINNDLYHIFGIMVIRYSYKLHYKKW